MLAHLSVDGLNGFVNFSRVRKVITFLTDLDPAQAEVIADLVNQAYADSERGLWIDGTQRTDAREVAAVAEAGELAVAHLNGRPVGVIRIQQLDPDTAEFGMLATDPAVRGRGVGRDLVRFAEDTCRHRGSAKMQLKLLTPRHWVLDSKEALHAWYSRLGYEPARVGLMMEQDYPELASQLADPADYRIYLKHL
jgi:GNAT superfamily N-acetyltransferase